MTQIVCKDTHKRRDYKIKLHLFTFIRKNKNNRNEKKGRPHGQPFLKYRKIQIGMT